MELTVFLLMRASRIVEKEIQLRYVYYNPCKYILTIHKTQKDGGPRLETILGWSHFYQL